MNFIKIYKLEDICVPVATSFNMLLLTDFVQSSSLVWYSELATNDHACIVAICYITTFLVHVVVAYCMYYLIYLGLVWAQKFCKSAMLRKSLDKRRREK